MKDRLQKYFYAILRCQVFSSNGKFLFVSSNHGDIAIFNVEKIVTAIKNVSSDFFCDPLALFHIEDKIFSLAFHREFLIIGSSGKIFGHQISSQGIIGKRSWTIQLPMTAETNEVNSLWVDQENDCIYAGCGDGNLYACSLEDGRVMKTFCEHLDYIHSVDGFEKLIVTGSQDGFVKFWDTREDSSVFALQPSKNAKISRSNFGNWIGSVCINKEWTAIGGGPAVALYHLRNREPFQIFDYPKEIHVASFIDDNLIVAGESNAICQYSIVNGGMISEMQASGPSIFSIAWQKHSDLNILSACGSSNKIEVSTNFHYKDSQLNFYAL